MMAMLIWLGTQVPRAGANPPGRRVICEALLGLHRQSHADVDAATERLLVAKGYVERWPDVGPTFTETKAALNTVYQLKVRAFRLEIDLEDIAKQIEDQRRSSSSLLRRAKTLWWFHKDTRALEEQSREELTATHARARAELASVRDKLKRIADIQLQVKGFTPTTHGALRLTEAGRRALNALMVLRPAPNDQPADEVLALEARLREITDVYHAIGASRSDRVATLLTFARVFLKHSVEEIKATYATFDHRPEVATHEAAATLTLTALRFGRTTDHVLEMLIQIKARSNLTWAQSAALTSIAYRAGFWADKAVDAHETLLRAGKDVVSSDQVMPLLAAAVDARLPAERVIAAFVALNEHLRDPSWSAALVGVGLRAGASPAQIEASLDAATVVAGHSRAERAGLVGLHLTAGAKWAELEHYYHHLGASLTTTLNISHLVGLALSDAPVHLIDLVAAANDSGITGWFDPASFDFGMTEAVTEYSPEAIEDSAVELNATDDFTALPLGGVACGPRLAKSRRQRD